MTNADKIDGIIRGLEAYKTHGPDAFPLGVLAMLGKLMNDLGEACTAAAKRKAMEQLEASNTTCAMTEGGVRFEYDPTGDEPDVRLTFLEKEPQQSEHAIPIGEAQWKGPGGIWHWAVGDHDVARGMGTMQMQMQTACGKHAVPHGTFVKESSTLAITCPECFVLSLAQR